MKSILKKIITTKGNIDFGLLILRLFASFSLLKTHGIPKLLNFQETIEHIPDPLGLGASFSAYYAIFTNVICALLIALGLFTRLAALLIVVLTLSGLFLIHFNDSAKLQDVPLIYSIVFGYIAYMGAGKYSIDHKLFKK